MLRNVPQGFGLLGFSEDCNDPLGSSKREGVSLTYYHLKMDLPHGNDWFMF
jgi:hypothetical protein